MQKLIWFFSQILSLCKKFPSVTIVLLIVIIFNSFWLTPIIECLDVYFTPDASDENWIKFCKNGHKYHFGPPLNNNWAEFTYNEKRFTFYFEIYTYKFFKICLYIGAISFIMSLCYAFNLPFYKKIYLKLKRYFQKIFKN